MELINEVPPIKVDGRIAVCEGGRHQSSICILYFVLHILKLMTISYILCKTELRSLCAHGKHAHISLQLMLQHKYPFCPVLKIVHVDLTSSSVHVDLTSSSVHVDRVLAVLKYISTQ